MANALMVIAPPTGTCQADPATVRSGYFDAMTQRERVEANLGRHVSDAEWSAFDDASNNADVYA